MKCWEHCTAQSFVFAGNIQEYGIYGNGGGGLYIVDSGIFLYMEGVERLAGYQCNAALSQIKIYSCW